MAAPLMLDILLDKLFTIQHKHPAYFIRHGDDIFAGLTIDWTEPPSIRVTDGDMPQHIKADIESIVL
jgi:hypothetical protein